MELVRLNIEPVINKIKHCLNIWSQRYLSLFGKIEIVKTLAISKLIYILTLLPSPNKSYRDTIDKLLSNFVWSGKPAKIRANVLKSKKNMGGAGMVDLKIKDICLKLGWLNRLNNLEGLWKDYTLFLLVPSELQID